MAGHSKWAKVKHFKGAIDAKRGKIFSKLSKEITIASKLSGGDPNMNPRLRSVIADANAVVANLLAGETQITVDSPLAFQQGMIVRREWAPRSCGTSTREHALSSRAPADLASTQACRAEI